MVSILWAVIAFSSGLLAYLLPAVLGGTLPAPIRQSLADHYWKQALRSYRQLAIVRRQLGHYELLPMGIDDEQDLAEVTLSSGLLSDDQTLKFNDPTGSMKRLYDKPVAIVYDRVPAVTSPELAEIGEWLSDHTLERGDGEHVTIDPYLPVSDGLRVADPANIVNMLFKNTEPEDIETAEELTERRFEKYGDSNKLVVSMGTLMGFGVGAMTVVGIDYAQSNIINSGGGGQPVNPSPLISWTIDTVAVVL